MTIQPLNIPQIPQLPNLEEVAKTYTIPQDPRFYDAIVSLLPNQSGAIDFKNIDLAKNAFVDPFQPDIAAKITQLHRTAIDDILSGPSGYNGGLGPMTFDRAQKLLRSLGGDYPIGVFGEPEKTNVFSVVLAPSTTEIFSRASNVPQSMSLLGYSSHVVPNLPFYMSNSRAATFILQSGKNTQSFKSVPELTGPFYDPCGLTNLLFGPLVTGLRLISHLISEMVNLIANLLVSALDTLLSPIYGILNQIAKTITSALESIARALFLNEVSGLVAQIISLLNDPCLRFLMSGGGGFGKGILNQPLKTALKLT